MSRGIAHRKPDRAVPRRHAESLSAGCNRAPACALPAIDVGQLLRGQHVERGDARDIRHGEAAAPWAVGYAAASVARSSASPATRPHSHGVGLGDVRMPTPLTISRTPYARMRRSCPCIPSVRATWREANNSTAPSATLNGHRERSPAGRHTYIISRRTWGRSVPSITACLARSSIESRLRGACASIPTASMHFSGPGLGPGVVQSGCP